MKTLCALLCVGLLAAGCAGTQVQNQYEAFVVIDKEFTALAEQYNLWYQAATPELQAKWKKSIDPLFLRADELLDIYQTVLLAGADPAAQVAELRTLKTQILTALAQRYK